MKVIGFAGSNDKCNWLKSDLKFDYAFNYKEISLNDALKQAAPNGVNVFFDNVCCSTKNFEFSDKKKKRNVCLGWWSIFSRNDYSTYGARWSCCCLWFNC